MSDEPMGNDCCSLQASFILPNGIAARQDDVCLPPPTDIIDKIDNPLFDCQLKHSRKGKEVDMRTVGIDAVECVSLRCEDIELVD